MLNENEWTANWKENHTQEIVVSYFCTKISDTKKKKSQSKNSKKLTHKKIFLRTYSKSTKNSPENKLKSLKEVLFTSKSWLKFNQFN